MRWRHFVIQCVMILVAFVVWGFLIWLFTKT